MASSVGIHGDAKARTRYSNHSLRATLPTILYQHAFDEQLISEITRHRSLHGVRSYKRAPVALLSSAINTVTSTVSNNNSDDDIISKDTQLIEYSVEKYHKNDSQDSCKLKIAKTMEIFDTQDSKDEPKKTTFVFKNCNISGGYFGHP